MVAPLVWTLFMVEKTSKILMDQFRQQWANDVEFQQWIVKKSMVYVEGKEVESKVTNLCMVFAWAAEVMQDILGQ